MPLSTPLTELLRIEHPVLLAPMGMVSGGALAAAVTRGGGLGMIGAGYGKAEWLDAEFDAAGNARVGVGFITWSLDRQPELLDLCLERKPAAVMLSFGDPTPYVAKIKQAGGKVICQIQNLRDAKAAVQAGADIIVAQGTEAGGHGASRATLPLVPAVVDAAGQIPVVAAGGIADGRGVAAALALGAAGVLLGSYFYISEESLVHPRLKQAVLSASGDDVVRTKVFDMVRGYTWPEPYTGAALANSFLKRWHGNEDELRSQLDSEMPRYAEAAAEADPDTHVLFISQSADLLRESKPAEAMLEKLMAQTASELTRLAELAKGL